MMSIHSGGIEQKGLSLSMMAESTRTSSVSSSIVPVIGTGQQTNWQLYIGLQMSFMVSVAYHITIIPAKRGS